MKTKEQPFTQADFYRHVRLINNAILERSLGLYSLSDTWDDEAILDCESEDIAECVKGQCVKVAWLFFEGPRADGYRNDRGEVEDEWHGDSGIMLCCDLATLARTVKSIRSMPRLSLTRLVKDGHFESRTEAGEHIAKYGNFEADDPGYWSKYHGDYLDWFRSQGWEVEGE